MLKSANLLAIPLFPNLLDWIYYPNKNGKTSQNEIESSQNALCYIQRSFCCDVLEKGFYMSHLCQTTLW